MEVVFQERLYKAQRDESTKLSETRATTLLFPCPTEIIDKFPKAKEFADAISDMCALEGQLEKKRREMALRADFNMCDAYKLFT
jgi:hypothetical protein